MKNKKNIFFLVPAILIIWGLIGYRIYKAVNPLPIETITTNTVDDFKPKKIATTKSYTINAAYRDPFLGTLTSNIMRKRKVATTVTKPKEQLVFPTIVYKGIVSPKTSRKSAVYLVQINGQQNLLKLRSASQEITLISGNGKEIVLEYKKERKTYLIQ